MFEYAEAWLERRESFALEPDLALGRGPQYRRKTRDGSIFHRAIADTEPDGWGKRVILRDHAKRRQADRQAGREVDLRPLGSLDFLLAVDDASRLGALRFRDEQGRFQRTPDQGQRGIPPLIELAMLFTASRAVENNSETAADLAYLRGRGTSVGGLRPKCTVVDDDGMLGIGKFPSVSDEGPVTKGEVLALRLASGAGIDACSARLIDCDGTPVALIRRFDRDGRGGRLMFVSAATLLGADNSDPGDHAYTEIVDALRAHGADVQADIDELWRRMAFSILITNVDDHLKNHGFLHVERGKWRLSPAFDLNPFPERARELKTWVSEEAGPSATVEALMSVTPYFRIPPARAKKMLGRVEQAVARWREVGMTLGMTRHELESFEDAFEHAERDHARRLAAT